MNKCKQMVEFQGIAGHNNYAPCNRAAKYSATFLEGTTGKEKTKLVCGVHTRSLEQTAVRLLSKMQWDMKLQITEL